MLNIGDDELKESKSAKLLMPDANTYTAQAMSTLGFSHQTTGYWKHGFWSQTGLWALPFLSKAMHKSMMRLNKKKTCLINYLSQEKHSIFLLLFLSFSLLPLFFYYSAL